MGILDGKVAIVTGAGKGLGVSEAIALAKEGAAVTVCARTLADVQNTAKQIEALGGRALAVQCDVRDREQVKHVVQETVNKFGTVDILINNAQIVFDAHPLEAWSDEEMRATWESGALASWYFMVACFPYLKQNRGRVINFCSPAGHGRFPGMVGYSMAKEAVRSLTRCGAREWGQYGITVNVISPVAMSAAGKVIFDTQEKQDALFAQLGSPLRQFGDPESDVGRACVYLAGPDGKHITGLTLSIDGGAAML